MFQNMSTTLMVRNCQKVSIQVIALILHEIHHPMCFHVKPDLKRLSKKSVSLVERFFAATTYTSLPYFGTYF
jgi:predicted metal-dependent peptidase